MATLRLAVFVDTDLAGHLLHDAESNRFAFEYSAQWQAHPRSFAITPRLPLQRNTAQSPEAHSSEVRQFFENLLPEGEALDHAALAHGVSKANLVGLLIGLGRETAGALRIVSEPEAVVPAPPAEALRPLLHPELSDRVRRRAEIPFSVWDRKVRLSIAGYQDKIAVYEREGDWFFVEGSRLASTLILKPEPVSPRLAGLTSNEFTCMRLAQRAGLDVAPVRLAHVPEPVLCVARFDRVPLGDPVQRVRRLHVIDGCQALGLSAGMKYERPYGDGRDVRNIRDGASLPRLFALLQHSPQPVLERRKLLHWVIFQVLVGNTDAHGKNLSFFCGPDGLRVAPAYDLLCMAALPGDRLEDSFAMAVGDAFLPGELTAHEWAWFAQTCALPPKLVAQELQRGCARVVGALAAARDDALAQGAVPEMVHAVVQAIARVCASQSALAALISKAKRGA